MLWLALLFLSKAEAEPAGLRLLYHRLQKRLHHTPTALTHSHLAPSDQASALQARQVFIRECDKILEKPRLSALNLLELLDELDTEAALTEQIATEKGAPYPLVQPKAWSKLKSDQAKCKQSMIWRAKAL